MLEALYSFQVGCIRSWDYAKRTGYPDEGQYHEDNLDQHNLVIIDNMVSDQMHKIACRF